MADRPEPQTLLVDSSDEQGRDRFSADESLDLVLAFDTSASMYSHFDTVRNRVTELVAQVQAAIPNSAFAVVAFGDYCDEHSTYLTKSLDFTADLRGIRAFVRQVSATGGGDYPEAIEEALYEANRFSWRTGTRRALILVGDAPPHGVVDSRRECRHGHFYEDEALSLAAKSVRIYAVQCQGGQATSRSFQRMADISQGQRLRLEELDDLVDLLVAICMREMGILTSYVDRVVSCGPIKASRQRLLEVLSDNERVT